MGICSSCESTSVATAKLILQDGRLQEFSYPVKVSHILHNYPSSFICNSDDMEFNVAVSAIRDDHQLQPGQLYFALPLDRLKRPLQAEEMAALAVKASTALAKSGGGKCGCCGSSLCEKLFSGESRHVKASRRVADDGGGVGGLRKKRGGKKQNFTAMLSAIPE